MYRYLINIKLPWTLPIIGDAFRVPSYGVMLAIGALAGVYLGVRRADKTDFHREEIVDISVFVVLSGVVGARLFYVLEHYEDYFFTARRFLRIFAIWEGGLVFYGGLFMAIAYIAFHFMRRGNFGERLVSFWDLAAPSTVIGLAFGRIGCFLNGCCYGQPTDLPWGVTFPPDSPIFSDFRGHTSYVYRHCYELAVEYGMSGPNPGRSFPVHPTQLYAALALFLITGLLYWYWPRRKGNGEVVGIAMITYAVFRFLIEFIRINPATFSWAPLSISQWMSFPAVLFGLYLFLGSRGWINPRWKALHPLEPALDDASENNTAAGDAAGEANSTNP